MTYGAPDRQRDGLSLAQSILILSLGIIVLVFAVRGPRVVQFILGGRTNPSSIEKLVPKPGQSIRSLGMTSATMPFKADKNIILALGDCSSCSRMAIDVTILNLQPGIDGYFVTSAPGMPIPKMLKEKGWKEIPRDGPRISHYLSIGWLPRIYVFDRAGHLTWNQSSSNDVPDGVFR